MLYIYSVYVYIDIVKLFQVSGDRKRTKGDGWDTFVFLTTRTDNFITPYIELVLVYVGVSEKLELPGKLTIKSDEVCLFLKHDRFLGVLTRFLHSRRQLV